MNTAQAIQFIRQLAARLPESARAEMHVQMLERMLLAQAQLFEALVQDAKESAQQACGVHPTCRN